jgi:hypothetical protein
MPGQFFYDPFDKLRVIVSKVESMKKIFLTITLALTALLFVGTANAQIVTGNANSQTVIVNCVNNTHINSSGTGCVSNDPGGNPTPPPSDNPGNPGGGNPGGGSGGGSGAGSCTLGTPGNVILVSVVKVSPTSVKLSWTSASGATGYSIEYGTKSNSYTYGVPNTGNVTSYNIGSLDLSKAYFFRVIALNGCAQGDPSNEVSTAFGGAVLGLSNTSSQDNSVALLALAMALGAAGAGLLFISLRKNA